MKLHGLTFEGWAKQLFEDEDCGVCGGDASEHLPGELLGNWFAICAPVSVWDDLISAPAIKNLRTVKEAEAWIAEREKIEPEAVHAGRYGIDAPEGWE